MSRPGPGQAGAAPVIAIDGPTASGKGTVAQRVAHSLGYHYLDSGALYRLVALAALDGAVPLGKEADLAQLAGRIDIRFERDQIFLDGRLATERIRTEAVGNAASAVAVMPALRAALVARQRAFRQPPGLVADGRDMGTVIFPDAILKIFLTASAEARAERRYKQLIEKGFSANMATLLQDLRERDARDAGRATAPLMAAQDAITIDSTDLGIEQVVGRILDLAGSIGIRATQSR